MKKWLRGKYVGDDENSPSHIHVHAQGLSLAQERRQFWREICVAVAGASNTDKCDVATSWANTCLKAFDEKFTK